MSRFAVTEKEEFLNTLKYPECRYCTATMFCKFGCMEPDYPQGLADFKHKRWEEVIRTYIKYYEQNNIKSNNLAEHIRRAKIELKRRDDANN